MPVIEFVNHIELLCGGSRKGMASRRAAERRLAVLASAMPNVSTPIERRHYLALPLAIGERIRFSSLLLPTPPPAPTENIRGCDLQKFPRKP